MDSPTQRFNEAYEAYADSIFRHIYFRISDRERALELTQEVFSGFWKQLNTGVHIKHPQAFLYRSAHNAFVNELRDRKHTVSLESLMNTGVDFPHPGPNAEELALQREVVEKMGGIDEPYREALLLRYVDGLQVKEIAALTGENENTVSVRLKRGIEKLKTLYATS